MLAVKNLSIAFARYKDGWHRNIIHPVRDISLKIEQGQIVAVVGSSGSGKSLLAHAVLGLLPTNARVSGDILYKDSPLTMKRIKRLRGREIALIPQSVTYLNPLHCVGRQVYRASRLSGQCCSLAARNTDQVFSRYHLEEGVKHMYPFQVSGGMARRVLTATATAGDADLLIADEPTTGLDHDVIRQSLGHLRELADQGKSVMLITHDLEAAVSIADRVAVIYAGTTLEVAPSRAFHQRDGLRHPYSRALWNALPQCSFRYLAGNQPGENDTVQGCTFYPRCPERDERCLSNEVQPLRTVGENRVRCIHA